MSAIFEILGANYRNVSGSNGASNSGKRYNLPPASPKHPKAWPTYLCSVINVWNKPSLILPTEKRQETKP